MRRRRKGERNPAVKILLQRVRRASVTVEGRMVGRIDGGLLLFVGVERGDDERVVEAAAGKVASLRIFADDAGRMNLDILQAGGSALVVSQFTLAASIARGRRPSFDAAAPPDLARRLVDAFVVALARAGMRVESGVFGAHMDVELLNDGPVTFMLDMPAPNILN
jgi:D-tyrosyl-tRNA(Tyr) deacylase